MIKKLSDLSQYEETEVNKEILTDLDNKGTADLELVIEFLINPKNKETIRQCIDHPTTDLWLDLPTIIELALRGESWFIENPKPDMIDIMSVAQQDIGMNDDCWNDLTNKTNVLEVWTTWAKTDEEYDAAIIVTAMVLYDYTSFGYISWNNALADFQYSPLGKLYQMTK